MQKLLKNVTNEKLKAYFIWVPILRMDSREWALKRAQRYSGERYRHFWDGSKAAANAWQKHFDHEGAFWDAYFLYDSEVEWKKGPTEPTLWMQQLKALEKLAPRLKIGDLEKKTIELLDQISE